MHLCVTGIIKSVRTDEPVVGALEALDYLLAAGADVDARDDRWIDDHKPTPTPLLFLLGWPELFLPGGGLLHDVAMRLIDGGADLNARNFAQMRPLDFAAELPSLDIFRALVAKGADPSRVPYIVQVAPGLEGAGESLGTHYLADAIQNNRVDVLQAASAAGVNLKKIKTLARGSVPLLAEAAQGGRVECVRFLLDIGANVNEVHELNGDKRTAWDAAVDCLNRGGLVFHLQIMTMLIPAGGKPFSEL